MDLFSWLSVLRVGVIVVVAEFWGFVVVCTLLPLRFFSAKTYTDIVNRIQGAYCTFLSFILRWHGGLSLRCTGDNIDPMDPALIIANHLNHDYAAAAMFHALWGNAGYIRTVIKASLGYVPLFGWLMKLNNWPFVSRDYAKDERNLKKLFATYRDYGVPIQLWIYCEGTRRSTRNLAKSQEFAKAHGYPVWQHVMIPRHRGFCTAVNSLRGTARYVYDVTLHYEGWGKKDDGSHAVPSVGQLLVGARVNKWSRKVVHVDVRRVEIDAVPQGDEAQKQFLMDLFAEKEKRLAFFEKHGRFDGKSIGALDADNPLDAGNRLSVFAVGGLTLVFSLVASLWGLRSYV